MTEPTLALQKLLRARLLASPAVTDQVAPDDIGDIGAWRKGGDRIVYVQNGQNQWYRVDMQQACMKYDTSKGIRFLTEKDDQVGRYSVVDVGHRECRVKSITQTNTPPPA